MSDAVIALALIFLGVFLLVVASADMLVARTDEVTALRLDEGVSNPTMGKQTVVKR